MLLMLLDACTTRFDEAQAVARAFLGADVACRDRDGLALCDDDHKTYACTGRGEPWAGRPGCWVLTERGAEVVRAVAVPLYRGPVVVRVCPEASP